MRIGITGAGGFVGEALVSRLARASSLSAASAPIEEIVAIDSRLPAVPSGVIAMQGDLADAAFREAILARPFDAFIHLAAIPGGAAAVDYALGWSVNVEALVGLLGGLARQAKPTRFVFASSIGVFGSPLPADRVDDETLPLPSMSYGAQKLIGETLLADYSRRGLIDGLSVRLPGIVARPQRKTGHLSAYLSNIFHAAAAGEAFECPVSASATSWFMSLQCCVDNLLHAAALRETGPRTSFNLPALRLSMADLVETLAEIYGRRVRELVTYAPNVELEAQFGAYPELFTPLAESLGFRHDGTARDLVLNALGRTRIEMREAS